MLNRLFGNYLVEKQMMTQEQLDSMLPVRKDVKAEVETIVVVYKILTPSAVMEIVEDMDRESERFGERAVDEGYLSDEKLDQIIVYQSNAFMKFVQGLLDKKLVSLDRINQVVDDFRQSGGYSEVQMDALIYGDVGQGVDIFVPLKSDMLKAFVVTLVQAMRKLIDSDMYMDKAYTEHSLQLDKYASQSVYGDMYMKVYISAPENGLLGIANYFTGDTYGEVDEDALDSVSEFINCVNGMFATNLSYDDILIDMNSPEFSLEGPYISDVKMYVLPVHANGYSFKVVIEVHE